jgi:diguanylate cyclase (GGDEF)-like protein
VNRKTLSLFEAENFQHLIANLGRIFRDDMLKSHVGELEQLWEGRSHFASQTVNYALGGRRLDIQLNGTVLPGYEHSWERVLIAIEDVTERETARRRLAISEEHARGLFEHSPVSLWVEDFSTVKQLLDDVRAQGIVDFRVFIDVHPEFVSRCMSEIRVLDVNRRTLEMFAADDRTTLMHRIGDVFRADMERSFKEQLVDLWEGRLFQLREVVNYSLDGTELHVLLQFSVLPGHEDDWSLVQVALTDITARKKAEAYLEYLGKHDVLTKLYNRSFYVDELARLERKAPFPVTIVMADLNGLKETNDQRGHAAGDALLRRVGEVLAKAVDRPWHAARIGGDEFAIILPAADARQGEAVMETIRELIELNNQFYSGPPLNLSIGAATATLGERLESVARRADAAMYAEKRQYYLRTEAERRKT